MKTFNIGDYVQIHMNYKNSSFENKHGIVIKVHNSYVDLSSEIRSSIYTVFISLTNDYVSCFDNELELVH